MSWLTEGPLSNFIGGNRNQDSTRSSVTQGMRIGAAFGPVGMAAGALGGWLLGRSRNNAMTQASIDMSERAGQGVNWDLNSNSPLQEFDSPNEASADAPPESPSSNGPGAGPSSSGAMFGMSPGSNMSGFGMSALGSTFNGSPITAMGSIRSGTGMGSSAPTNAQGLRGKIKQQQ